MRSFAASRNHPSRQWPARQREVALLGGYRLLAVHGRGRRSVVYRAWNDGLERVVALKVTRRAQLAAMGGRHDFSHEYQLAADLQHPHLIRALHHGVEGQQAFLAMELAEGGSLVQQDHPLNEQEVFSRLRQVASGLAFLHQQGWVHCDLKPANLLVGKDRSLMLGDFGSVVRRGEVARQPAGVIIGTPQYAAPEQSLGVPASAAADVYSLGVLLHEWLCGRPPYPGQTVAEIFGQHQLAPIPTLSADHAGWQTLLNAMLAKLPTDRLPDGQAVLDALVQREHLLTLSFGPGGPNDKGQSM